MPAVHEKLNILLIALNHKEVLDDLFKPLFDTLYSHAHVQRAKKAGTVLRLLEKQPDAVLITDEAITWDENAHAWKAVIGYVREGGTAILMGSFSSFTGFYDFKPFFAKAGLPWEAGEYHRTTFVLNRGAVSDSLAAKLEAQYSQKAIILKNVSLNECWYVTNQDSVIESLVFAPANAHQTEHSPVTLARIGKGKLGYIGDVNFETGSNTAILAMCGIY